MSRDRHVVIIGTGGTISSRYDPEKGRTVASQDLEDLLALLPESTMLPRMTCVNFVVIPSFNMTLPLAWQLVQQAGRFLEQPEVDGVVVTQGTDTMEETSFLADILLDSKKPVVFTGAQLPHDHPQSDGPRNILDSVRAAAADAAAELGSIVCFNGELHAARDVTKVHTSALETFQSYHHGALGVVDGEKVVIHRRPTLRLHLRPAHLDKRVALIKLAMGTDARFLEATLGAGIDGLVVEAFGRGNVPAEFGKGLAQACRDGLPVVVTSRCPAGRVKPIYGGGGGGRDLEDAGVLFAGDLKGPKARLLLTAALADSSVADPSVNARLGELFRRIAP